MATTSKKRGSCHSALGRPSKGALSTFDPQVAQVIKQVREKHSGWGAISILDELGQCLPTSVRLPSIDSINRYLKQAGLVFKYEPHGTFPRQKCQASTAAHDLWEMDAQGAVPVGGLGCQAMINIKDSHTRTHCMAFPIPARHQRCQPSRHHYQWALRLAFEEIGLPGGLQVDKDSVFYENMTKSPYPMPIHLWLVALGVKMCHVEVPPPQKQSVVERSHQTMERQALRGQHYDTWKQLFDYCQKRRQRLNQHLPNRSLGKKSPWEAFPQATHSERPFSIESEYDQLDPQRIYNLLAQGVWYRTLSSGKMVSLGRQRYYLKNANPGSQVQITFDPLNQQFIFRHVNEQLITQLPPKGISKEELMGTTNAELILLKAKLLNSNEFTL